MVSLRSIQSDVPAGRAAAAGPAPPGRPEGQGKAVDQPASPHPGAPRQRPFPLQLRLGPLLADCGIARVAPVTHLDVIGIPVAAATRPLAVTLRVTHGAGRTDEEAQAEAAGEAIRLWHAESAGAGRGGRGQRRGTQPRLPARRPRPAARGAGRGEHPDGMGPRADGAWRARALVPRDLVRLVRPPGRPGMLAATDIGLAAGPGRDAAVARALFDVMERDAGRAPCRARTGRSAAWTWTRCPTTGAGG